MINSFKELGKVVLEKDGYYQTDDEETKRDIFLFHQSIVPQIYRDKNNKDSFLLDGKAICLNFDLENDCFEFKLSEYDLTETNRNKFLAFKLNAPRAKKKFFSTNSIVSFFSIVFSENRDYLKKELPNIKKVLSQDTIDKYYLFIDNIISKFYIKQDKTYILNPVKLSANQKNNLKVNNKTKINDNFWHNYIKKRFYISDYPNISLITFNDQTITECNNNQFKDIYLTLCYQGLINYYYLKPKLKKSKLCHICQEEKNVTGDISLSMKFYGTTNNLNFENLLKGNAYKSFSICKDCLIKTMTGMKTVEDKLNKYLFDMHLYIIPKSKLEHEIDYDIYEKIVLLFSFKKNNYNNEIQNVLNRAKRRNLKFDFLFYNNQGKTQEFNVLKLISNIELSSLLKKFEKLNKYSEMYKLELISNNALTFGDLRFSIFPSELSHNKDIEYSLYSKDLLNLMDRFIKGQKINQQDLIRKFINIYKKRLHNDKVDILSAFKIVIFMSIFNEINPINKGEFMKVGNMISEILNENYKKFFETHSSIYEGDAHKQGLFLLGVQISKIMKAQQKKRNLTKTKSDQENNSESENNNKKEGATFINKLNMDGVSVRRVQALVNQVYEYSVIYEKEIFSEPGLWGNITDRLQGITESNLKPDEVLFFILTGVSYNEYLIYRISIEKKINSKGVNDESDTK